MIVRTRQNFNQESGSLRRSRRLLILPPENEESQKRQINHYNVFYELFKFILYIITKSSTNLVYNSKPLECTKNSSPDRLSSPNDTTPSSALQCFESGGGGCDQRQTSGPDGHIQAQSLSLRYQEHQTVWHVLLAARGPSGRSGHRHTQPN